MNTKEINIGNYSQQDYSVSAREILTSRSSITAIRRIDLTSFRNYSSLRIDVDPTPVILTGANGAGKTNLLEALSFLAPGRGLRRARLDEIAKCDDSNWAIAVRIERPTGEIKVGSGISGKTQFGRIKKRIVQIDGKQVGTQAELAKHFSIIWLTPEMDRIFLDGSSGRRRFLDRMTFGFNPEHAQRLSTYEQALRARQKLLKDNNYDPDWLSVLETTLATEGVAISALRIEVIKRLNDVLCSTDFQTGQSSFPIVDLELVGEVDSWLYEGPALAAEDRLKSALFEAREEDRFSGRTNHGIHRSDLKVTHINKEMPAALCSTGEQKILLIAIILAHSYLLTLDYGLSPILLLDEITAHLDDKAREGLAFRILDLGLQAWLTGSDKNQFTNFYGSAQFLKIEDDNISVANGR